MIGHGSDKKGRQMREMKWITIWIVRMNIWYSLMVRKGIVNEIVSWWIERRILAVWLQRFLWPSLPPVFCCGSAVLVTSCLNILQYSPLQLFFSVYSETFNSCSCHEFAFEQPAGRDSWAGFKIWSELNVFKIISMMKAMIKWIYCWNNLKSDSILYHLNYDYVSFSVAVVTQVFCSLK